MGSLQHSPAPTIHNTHLNNTTISSAHLLSTSKKCNAANPSTKNAPDTIPRPATSRHSANTLKPKLLKIALPGTSMLRPYFLSISDR